MWSATMLSWYYSVTQRTYCRHKNSVNLLQIWHSVPNVCTFAHACVSVSYRSCHAQRSHMPVLCRGMIPKVKEALAMAPQSVRAARAFLALWDDLCLVLDVHMKHEDDVIFPAADGWIPHHSDPFADVRFEPPSACLLSSFCFM